MNWRRETTKLRNMCKYQFTSSSRIQLKTHYRNGVKENIDTLVTAINLKHEKQMDEMSDMNQQLEKEKKLLKEKLASKKEKFKNKDAHTEKYIQTLKNRIAAEKEWKKYYKQCHSTYEEEYIRMVESFKVVRAHYDNLKGIYLVT